MGIDIIEMEDPQNQDRTSLQLSSFDRLTLFQRLVSYIVNIHNRMLWSGCEEESEKDALVRGLLPRQG